MSMPAVLVTGLIGVFVSPIVIAAIRTVPDKDPLRDGFGSYRDLPRWAIAVAIVNGLLWGLAANKLSPWYLVVPLLLVASALVTVSVIDLQVFRIPDRITFPVLAALLVLLPLVTYVRIRDVGDTATVMRYALGGMAAYFLMLLIPHLISPKGMGFGDVKLGLVMGLYLGWLAGAVGGGWLEVVQLTVFAFFLGCVIGVVVGIVFGIVKRSRGAFPFGPALAAAVVFVVLTYENYIAV